MKGVVYPIPRDENVLSGDGSGVTVGGAPQFERRR